MPGVQRIGRLAWAQVALVAIACPLADIQLPDPFALSGILPPTGLRHLLTTPFLAIVMEQSLLTAVWAAFSGSAAWLRLVGLVAGSACLEALLRLGMRDNLFGLVTVTILVATASFLVVRLLGVRLARTDGQVRESGEEKPDRLRFSIRDLMILTVGVALLSSWARAMRGSAGQMVFLNSLWGICFVGICFVAVGLVALWAALGEGRPGRRGPFVFVLSTVLGVFFGIAASAHPAGCFYISLVMLMDAGAVFGSLLVVRSVGYRLVGKTKGVERGHEETFNLSGPEPG